MKRVVVVDDEREFVEGREDADVTYLKTAQNAIHFLDDATLELDELWFDHDLGMQSRGSGYDVACILERRAFEGAAPKIGKVFVHTANPSGGARIIAALERHFDVERISYPGDLGLFPPWWVKR